MERHIPDGLNLEYKSIDALRNPVNLSCGIAAFANSAGGLLVVGIGELKHGPSSLPEKIIWDRDPSHTPEWIEAVLLNGIHPPIPGVRLEQVRNDEGGFVYLLDVPPSQNPPHMAPNGRYYYRSGSSTRAMEHFQVADAFGKRRRPQLRPTLALSRWDPKQKTFWLDYGLVNEGRSLAKWIMVHLKFVGCEVELAKDKGLWEHVRHEAGEDGLEEWFVTHESPMSVLHPEMMLACGAMRVRLSTPLALVSVLVGAEDAPTESNVAMIGEQWVGAKLPGGAKGKLEIPLLLAGDRVDPEGILRWQEQFAEDARAIGAPSLGRIVVRLFVALGQKYMTSVISQAVEDYSGPAATGSGEGS